MISHGTGLALIVVGGKRDEHGLNAYLKQNGIEGPLANLALDFLKGGLGKGPLITMPDFVKRAEGILQAMPHLAPRIEACLRTYNLTVATIDGYLKTIKGSSSNVFASALSSAKAG